MGAGLEGGPRPLHCCMTAATTTKEPDQTPLGMPPGHPAGQLIHQPPKKADFVPNETHVALFKAISAMKGTVTPDMAKAGMPAEDISLRGASAALLIAFMTDELGEKKLKKMSAEDVKAWAFSFKSQNPRLWPCFKRGAIVMLVQALSKDASHAVKGYAEWQGEVATILRSEPTTPE